MLQGIDSKYVGIAGMVVDADEGQRARRHLGLDSGIVSAPEPSLPLGVKLSFLAHGLICLGLLTDCTFTVVVYLLQLSGIL